LNRGQRIWKASHSNIWEKKMKIWKYKKLHRKQIWTAFRENVLRQERPLYVSQTRMAYQLLALQRDRNRRGGREIEGGQGGRGKQRGGDAGWRM